MFRKWWGYPGRFREKEMEIGWPVQFCVACCVLVCAVNTKMPRCHWPEFSITLLWRSETWFDPRVCQLLGKPERRSRLLRESSLCEHERFGFLYPEGETRSIGSETRLSINAFATVAS